jgi:pimeloyl-ACP methyl ester carboxylesterase
MFIKRYGSGSDNFLCLHGWSGDHLTFEPLVQFMPASASIFAADLPGCGLSLPPAQWDISSVAGEIADAFKDVAGSFTLVGNCIGALLGLCAALENPNAVHRLVLIDAFASWPWYFRVFTAPRWGRYAYQCTFANPAGRWIANRALARKRSGDSDLTQGFAAAHHDIALRYLHVLRELASVENFSGLRVPVDIIFGARTFRAIRESAFVWQSVWPWARVFEVPQAGHLPIREAAAEISHIIFEGGECQQQFATTSNSTAR